MRTTLYIGEWRVDQFKDESASVVSSVLDITDITRNTGDYSKTFTVPASKRNNILFKHWYDATIDNSFDARTKVAGRIELDGLPFKIGKWRLSKVAVKKGKPSSYTINFFGNLVDLKSTVKKDELIDLDLSAYDHDYHSNNVLLGLSYQLFSGDVVYNLFPKKQYYYNNNSSDNVQTSTLANIALGGGADTGIIWNDLRPSIRLIKIIEAIETDYSIEFSRDFFGTSEFDKLFFWLNPETEKEAGGDVNVIDWSAGDTTWMNLTTDIGSYLVINTPAPNDSRYFELTCFVNPEPGYETVEYDIIANKDGEDDTTTSHVGDDSQFIELHPQGNDPGTTIEMKWKVRSTQEFQYRAVLLQEEFTNTNPNVAIRSRETWAGLNVNDSVFVIGEELPKIKIIDFLKGLFNMFKLIVVPQDDGTLYVDTLDSFYAGGSLHDVTKYVDFSKHNVDRGIILNEIEMKFQEPSTILNIEFEKNNRRGYGDEETTLEDDAGELLDGESLSFELPFEQIVYERLTDQNDNTLTNIQYGAIIDEDREPANPKAHIFYNIRHPLGSKNVAFIQDTGVRIGITTNINLPFHYDATSQQNYATIFKNEYSTWDGASINKNLYTRHYQDYISAIFNIKKRTFIYEAQLPIHIITKIELNDILKIKENYFRIDKYSYNLLTGKTTLTLVNSFDNTISPSRSQEENVFVDYRAQSEIITITNSEVAIPTKVDQGFGTTWVTLTATVDNKYITFTENTSTEARSMFLQYPSGGDTVTIYVTQAAELYVPKIDFSDARNSWQLSLLTLRT